MLQINEEELSNIIHELVKIASILKTIENGNLTAGQKQILHGCETRLQEIREKLLKSVTEKEEEKKK